MLSEFKDYKFKSGLPLEAPSWAIGAVDPGTVKWATATIAIDIENKEISLLNTILHIVENGHLPSDFFKEIAKKVYDTIPNNIECIISVEKMFLALPNRFMWKLIGVQEEISAMCRHLNLEYYEIPATTMKKFITGKGNADKKEVRKVINKLLSTKLKDDNITDAVGLGLIALAKKL